MKTRPEPFRMNSTRIAPALLALLLVSTSACINMRSDRGVEARWHDVGADGFEAGKTMRSEVLEDLGPPSQILSIAEGSAFYYMLETTRARGMILLVYNDRTERTRYDRAVFFFDHEEVLTDFALSPAPN